MLVLQIAFDFLFTGALKAAFKPEAREAAPTTKQLNLCNMHAISAQNT